MKNNLTKYKYLSNQALNLPTELLQVGFFRNAQLQNVATVKHCLTKQYYQLNGLFCDTVVETPLFNFLLIAYQRNAIDKKTNKEIIFHYGKGSELLKYLKLKGNYPISIIEKKLINFKNKFCCGKFNVDDKEVTIFSRIDVNTVEKTITIKFDASFIRYLNQRKYSLTFIQIPDFLAIKRKTQVPLFMLIQSVKGIKNAFFSKRYISDILGLTKDINKKLSVAFNKLQEKHAIKYDKQLCNNTGFSFPFSRFIIKEVDANFVSKIPKDKTKEASKKQQENTQNGDIQPYHQKYILTQKVANSPICVEGYKSNNNAVSCDAINSKNSNYDESLYHIEENTDLDELDEAWILGVTSNNTIAYRTPKGTLSVCNKYQLPKNAQIFTPEIMREIKIKKFIY